MAPIQTVLTRLTEAGFCPRQSGRSWSARCPGHGDRIPSLSVSVGDDNRVLLRCHAGCDVRAVVAALGLKMSDLFEQEARRGQPKGEIEAIYDYQDESGRLLYQNVRLNPKAFRVRRPDLVRGWVWNINGVRKVVYRLPGVIAAMRKAAPGDRTVCVVEGEKDVDRLWGLGLAATTNLGGAGKWTSDLTRQLKAAGVERALIIPDNDIPGQRHGNQVATSMADAGIRCRILRLPGLPPIKLKRGEDVSDWLDDAHTLDELLLAAEATPEWDPTVNTMQELDPPRQIIVRPELKEVVDEAQAALVGLGKAGIYQRGGILVRVVRDSARDVTWLARQAGSPSILALHRPHLRELLDGAAPWLAPSRGKKKKLTRVLPPMWAVDALMDRGEWPLPTLAGVIEAPTMRPDGSILEAPGYDTSTGLLYEPGHWEYPTIATRPSLEDAQAALALLEEPFRDFPFRTETDRSAFSAYVLTTLARLAIEGPCPLFALRAHTSGSGKGLLANAASVIATGRTATFMPPVADDVEARKRIFSLALEGAQAVVIDNVTGCFGSESIASALTAATLRDRVLGVSQTAQAPMRIVWALTGNNVNFVGDLSRRVVPCDLDPQMEYPEDRAESDFRHPDLLAYLLEVRTTLVVAALTILRAYHLAGLPKHGKARMGSFECWDDLVRGSLIWVGAADPLGGRERLRMASDFDREALHLALQAWDRVIGPEYAIGTQVIEKANENEEFKVALAAFVDCTPDKVDANRLGRRLSRFAGQIVGGLRFERDQGLTHGAARWRVSKTNGVGGEGGHGGIT